MKIKRIQWLSQAAAEAEVEISDGEFSCSAFACPCDAKIGDDVNEPLHVFSIKNAMLSEQSVVGIWKIDATGLSQRVVAKIVDVGPQLLAVGGIVLTVDEHLPGGLQNGNLLEFDCARIDLW